MPFSVCFSSHFVFLLIVYLSFFFQEVESIIHELAEEQSEIDELTAAVFSERMEIAKEKNRMTSLANVREMTPLVIGELHVKCTYTPKQVE